MAYDEELARRVRDLVAGLPGVTEKKMFGGLAFLVNGNMAIAASGEGGILVRVDPADNDMLVTSSAATVMVMRGRPMTGWLRVAPGHLDRETELSRWARTGTTYAASLPPKL